MRSEEEEEEEDGKLEGCVREKRKQNGDFENNC
jgi:hypothetical protein